MDRDPSMRRDNYARSMRNLAAGRFDAVDFDVLSTYSEEETTTNQMSATETQDWEPADNWENQESSSQVASQPFGATGGFRVGSELPYGLQSRSSTTVVAKSDDEDDDSTLKDNNESEPSTSRRQATVPPSLTILPTGQELEQSEVKEARSSPTGSQDSGLTCLELAEEPPKETGATLKPTNPLNQESVKRKPLFEEEAKAKMLAGTQAPKMTKKEKKMMDELEAKVKDLSNKINASAGCMRDLFQTASEKNPSTWYYDQAEVVGKMATEWFETVTNLNTFHKNFNDLAKIGFFDALRENMEKALNQFFHKAREMREFMKKREQELRDEQALMNQEQMRIKQQNTIDQLNQQYGMIQLDDPKIQFGQLWKQEQQQPKLTLDNLEQQFGERLQLNDSQKGFWRPWQEQRETFQPLMKKRKKNIEDSKPQEFDFRGANRAPTAQYDWHKGGTRYAIFHGDQTGLG